MLCCNEGFEVTRIESQALPAPLGLLVIRPMHPAVLYVSLYGRTTAWTREILLHCCVVLEYIHTRKMVYVVSGSSRYSRLHLGFGRGNNWPTISPPWICRTTSTTPPGLYSSSSIFSFFTFDRTLRHLVSHALATRFMYDPKEGCLSADSVCASSFELGRLC